MCVEEAFFNCILAVFLPESVLPLSSGGATGSPFPVCWTSVTRLLGARLVLLFGDCIQLLVYKGREYVSFLLQETQFYPEASLKMTAPCILPELQFIKKVSELARVNYCIVGF